MSRITGDEVASLMEAYSSVYAPQQEEVVEEVVEDLEVLDEAPMTAFQAAGGNAKLAQLNKNRSPRAGRVTASQLERQGQQNLYKAGGGDAAIAKGPTRSQNVRGGGTRQVPTLTRQDIINRGSVAAGSTPKPAAPAARPATPAARPAAPAARPAAPAATPAAAKPTTPAAKPTTTYAGAQGVKPVGTPLPANAVKPVPGAPAQNATFSAPEKTNILGNKASELAALQAKAKADTLAKKQTAQRPMGARERMLNQDVDMFDLVKGHLMGEGYADTEEAAVAIMANMSEEWKKTILEADSVAKMAERSARRREQRYGKQGGGGRDDYRPYTEDDYKNPKPGYGSSQVKPA